MLSFSEKTPGAAGILPTFLDENDPRPAAVQLHENYAHGGGWQPFDGFDFTYSQDLQKCKLEYPEDPTFFPIAYAQLRDEELILFPYSWIVIRQPDGAWQVARLD